MTSLSQIVGYVTAPGGIDAGTGFTVKKNGVGYYTIAFNAPFAQFVGGSVSQVYAYGSSTPPNASIFTATSKTHVDVFCSNKGAAADTDFTFVLFGIPGSPT